MPVKVIIKRTFKDLDFKKISQLLVQARTNAMNEPGYIASETLHNVDTPNEIVVLSMWEKKQDWDNFKDSAARSALEAGFSEMLESPTETAIYKMGMARN